MSTVGVCGEGSGDLLSMKSPWATSADDPAPTSRKVARIQFKLGANCRGNLDVPAKAKLHGQFELIKNNVVVYRQIVETIVGSKNLLDVEIGRGTPLPPEFVAIPADYHFKFHGFAQPYRTDTSIEITVQEAPIASTVLDI